MHLLRISTTLNGQRHAGTRRRGRDLIAKAVGVNNLFTVESGDQISALDPGLLSCAPTLNLANDHASSFFQAQTRSYVRAHFLHNDTQLAPSNFSGLR